jgi:uncharacterized membrane protein YraQ (UPF0718 family)
MATSTPTVRRSSAGGIACYYRPGIMIVAALVLVGSFWLASRYPQLLSKAEHIRDTLPSMAYSGSLFPVDASMPAWQRVLATMGNWLNSMKIGMGFGVLFGALLHTVLNYYPLKLGSNLYLNSVKGALVGVPAGVCANCSVPVACGVTRGAGRVEAALGFLFSSPNFNPVVILMTFTALPMAIGWTKYGILLAIIAIAVPLLVRWAERGPKPALAQELAEQAACAINLTPPCQQSLWQVLGELSKVYVKHVYELLRPTIVIMLCASLASSAALVLVPWNELLADKTTLKLAILSLLATAMPVPIALDVMFAGNLLEQGVPTGYVAMFTMTLGTYSLIPSIYLWREVSRRLAVALFLLFWAIGFTVGLMF